MKILTGVILAGMMSASLVCAENLTQANVEKAQAVIDSAVEAHGGSERLSALNSIVIEHESITVAVGQSRNPEPPWDRNSASGISAVDLQNSVFVTKNSGTAGGSSFDGGTIINGDSSYQLNYLAGTRASIAEPDFDTTSGPFVRVTPALLVRQVRDRAQNAYYLGETEVDDEIFDVVGFSMAVGPAISLYFEKESHLLRRSERVLAGFGLVEYRFNDYKQVAGMPFNREFQLYLNGDESFLRTNIKTRVNEPFNELLAVNDDLAEIPPVVPDTLARQEIGDGVYLIGGSGTYAMFVEMDDYVIAAGGTAGLPDRIELLREVVADKPIRYGVMTHHHFDHVLGVSAYEQEGATVVAANAHEKVVRDAAENGELLDFHGVDDRFVLEDQSRRVEIIDIGPTVHTEHLLVTWLPGQGILFEADHFAMPQAGPVPPARESTKSFARALKENNLDAQLIVSAHSARPGTAEDLQEALEKAALLVGKN